MLEKALTHSEAMKTNFQHFRGKSSCERTERYFFNGLQTQPHKNWPYRKSDLEDIVPLKKKEKNRRERESSIWLRASLGTPDEPLGPLLPYTVEDRFNLNLLILLDFFPWSYRSWLFDLCYL